MKSLIHSLSFLFILTLAGVGTKAQTVNITNALLSANPTSCATNTITVDVTVGCINYPYVNTTFVVTGNTIDVSVNYSAGAICLGAINFATHTENMPSVSGGTYTVNVRSYLNGALEDTWSPLTWVVVSCGPEADFDLNTNSICLPDSFAATNTSQASTSYSWFLNGGFISNNTNEVFYPTTPGPNTITLVATDGVTSDTTNEVVDVFLAAPSIELGADTSICASDSVTLGLGTTYTNVQWSTGETSQTILAGPGTYSITVSEPETCEASDTITVDVVDLGAFDVLTSGATNCDEAILEATIGFVNYNWSNGSTGSQMTTTMSGTYTVTATSNEGCEIVDSAQVQVFASPVVDLGNDTLICSNATFNILLDAGISGSYLWNDGSTLNFLGVNGTYGSYWVEVTDNNGCTGTDTINIGEKDCSSTGFNALLAAEEINVFPNPSSGVIHIQTSSTLTGINLYAIDGGVIPLNNAQFQGSNSANLDGLAGGIYLLEIETVNGVSKHKLVIE